MFIQPPPAYLDLIMTCPGQCIPDISQLFLASSILYLAVAMYISMHFKSMAGCNECYQKVTKNLLKKSSRNLHMPETIKSIVLGGWMDGNAILRTANRSPKSNKVWSSDICNLKLTSI